MIVRNDDLYIINIKEIIFSYYFFYRGINNIFKYKNYLIINILVNFYLVSIKSETNEKSNYISIVGFLLLSILSFLQWQFYIL